VTGPDLDELVAGGRIELVSADVRAAAALLEEAARHLMSAAAIASTDPNGAYALLYDAVRKAVTAHMLARGYRVASGRLGGHEAVVRYAEASLSEGPHSEHVAQLDRMRRARNRSEYGLATFGSNQLETDLQHARAIVAAVRANAQP
jgi:hypothetical protein